ncbi:MAG: YihY/virulence factor BrkB family protein [Clostridia bacterium]|nr:YihY/virulence factor BrkB family protein [Clostridia bacterium]
MKTPTIPAPKTAVGRFLRLVIGNVLSHNVLKSAAALTYYFFFALFPLLIAGRSLLVLTEIDVTAYMHTLDRFLPPSVVVMIDSYLSYLQENASQFPLWFSLYLAIWFPMSAVKELMDDVRLAYGVPNPSIDLWYLAKQLIYTVIFLPVVLVTLALTTFGESVLTTIGRMMPELGHLMLEWLPELWQYLRFLPIAALMLLTVGTLYRFSLRGKFRVRDFLPGILVALLSWIVVSIGFSYYVENFAKYSVIYGALGTIVALLLWMYMTSFVLILGAEFNAALLTMRKDGGTGAAQAVPAGAGAGTPVADAGANAKEAPIADRDTDTNETAVAAAGAEEAADTDTQTASAADTDEAPVAE